MKVIDIIKGEKPSLSFEVFPPKTSDNFESVMNAATEIAKLKPGFMSVTYGAGGGTSEYTADIADNDTVKITVSGEASIVQFGMTPNAKISLANLGNSEGIPMPCFEISK